MVIRAQHAARFVTTACVRPVRQDQTRRAHVRLA